MDYFEVDRVFKDRIAEIQDEVRQAEAKVAEAQTAYQEALSTDVMKGGKPAAKAVTVARVAWDHARGELADAVKKADLIQEIRIKRLAEAFPKFAEENGARIQAARDEYEQAAVELMRLRADTLLRLRELWKIAQEARAVHSETGRAAQAAGVDYHQRFEMPSLNLSSQFGGVDRNLIPTSYEVTEALHQGKVPAFVAYYGITGELVSENEASQRLRELKAKEDKK